MKVLVAIFLWWVMLIMLLSYCLLVALERVVFKIKSVRVGLALFIDYFLEMIAFSFISSVETRHKISLILYSDLYETYRFESIKKLI